MMEDREEEFKQFVEDTKASFDKLDLQGLRQSIKAKKLDLEVYEFNVFSQMRPGGSSNVNAGTCWEFFINLLKYRFGKSGSVKSE